MSTLTTPGPAVTAGPGPSTATRRRARRSDVRKWTEITIFVGPALILFLGIYPKPVLNVINPAVKATLSDVHQTDPAPVLGTVAGGLK